MYSPELKRSFGKLCTREEWLTKHKLFRNMFLHEDRSCGLTNSLSRLQTSPSSSYDSISHALIYVSACCASPDNVELVPGGLFRFFIAELVLGGLFKTGLLDLNESLFCRGLGPCGLCHKKMTIVDWSYEMGAGA
jgi:hypothetical protein